MESPLLLAEHSTEVLPLDASQASILQDQIDDKVLKVRPLFQPGAYELRTGSYVGTINCAGVQLIIKPKVAIGNVLTMLLPSMVDLDVDDAAFAYQTERTLTDAMAALYANAVAGLLRRGVRLGYRSHEERLVALGGRIDMVKQVRSPLSTPLACRFDEHTIDTDHNRMLKTAAAALLRFADINRETRNALLRTLTHLTGVAESIPNSAMVIARGFNGLDAHYETAVKLAAIVLEASSLKDAVGERQAATFLVDMSWVFEKYVTERLRDLLPDDVELSSQFHTTLAVDRHDPRHDVAIKPDLVLSRDRHPFAVADLKYITPTDDHGKNDNLYQIVSYCDALGVDEGALIYVHRSGSTERTLTVPKSRKIIRVLRVDISGTRGEIDASIHDVARRLTSHTVQDRILSAD